MEKDKEHIELVKEAKKGNKSTLDKLVEIARTRLSEYVRRIT